ncbi:NAD-dependent epimerase [Flavobacterium sp. MFBS3-15]|uniref:NAD-dependent epimerase n=1 Tax=Flavobacterium sp. MFBS3-15 TaxID=2989816 RepID=UPI00223628B0|nr:NAD-dependent epimerase [Flavobacterium sp. MFBS3-15]MCW4469556.1 NAD-dependent epimerase [Flavobacterium sp. MFBS3-15]
MKILVTGAAGFIGYHLCERLLAMGHDVVGLDNINDYYDVNLKYGRLLQLGIADPADNVLQPSSIYDKFSFVKMGLEERQALPALFEQQQFDIVCNLAAQAGVRYSLQNPFAYIDSNIVGFMNILECCRNNNVKNLVYASSSSIYGLNDKIPFSTDDNVDNPISLYAATKKSNELMAHTYSHLFGIKTTGLRFFTVYGPWGRPDMAMFLFTDAILKDKPIQVFNEGRLSRDFTYIDDTVQGIVDTLFDADKDTLYKVYNIGNSKPVKLLDFIAEIEKTIGREAKKDYLPMQPGDVERTWADVAPLAADFDYQPSTDISVGVEKFINWYKEYYKV